MVVKYQSWNANEPVPLPVNLATAIGVYPVIPIGISTTEAVPASTDCEIVLVYEAVFIKLINHGFSLYLA